MLDLGVLTVPGPGLVSANITREYQENVLIGVWRRVGAVPREVNLWQSAPVQPPVASVYR